MDSEMYIHNPYSKVLKATGSPGFFEVMDAHIQWVNIQSTDPKLERILTLIKLGLKETACIINPKDFGPIYKMKYGF